MDDITDSVDMSLSKLQFMVKDSEAGKGKEIDALLEAAVSSVDNFSPGRLILDL